MPDNNKDLNWDEKLSEGTDADGENADGENTDEASTDGTNENVGGNDPAKNKKLAEITIAERLRETYQLTLRIPKIFVGIHTNQFFFIELSDQFYESNYETIISAIADEKYGRFAGFEKGRFFIDKIVEKGGIDGFSTELTLNPIPKSLGDYARMQLEAEKALLEAVRHESGGTGGGSGVMGSGNLSGLDEIYSIAATFTYGGAGTGLSPEKAWEHYQNGGRNFDCYDCSNWLFYCLREKKIPCRIVQGYSPYAESGTHRVVQINENGQWHCPKQAWSLTKNLRPFTPEDKYPLKTLLEYNGG